MLGQLVRAHLGESPGGIFTREPRHRGTQALLENVERCGTEVGRVPIDLGHTGVPPRSSGRTCPLHPSSTRRVGACDEVSRPRWGPPFEGCSVPPTVIRSGLVRTLEERHRDAFGVIGGADELVRQHELSKHLVIVSG
jgi:hypothetical protein